MHANKKLVGRIVGNRKGRIWVDVNGYRWPFATRKGYTKNAEVDVSFDSNGDVKDIRPRKMAHKCSSWQPLMWSNKEVTLRCPRCEKTKIHALTQAELNAITGGKPYIDYIMYGATSIHRVWKDFRKTFIVNDVFKKTGYALMLAVTRWAKKYPDDVQIIGCDDREYTSSRLLLIEHKSEDRYHGTTAIFISQHVPPTQFFLYPEHSKSLIKALTAINKNAVRIQKIERANNVSHSKKVAAIFKKNVK